MSSQVWVDGPKFSSFFFFFFGGGGFPYFLAFLINAIPEILLLSSVGFNRSSLRCTMHLFYEIFGIPGIPEKLVLNVKIN